MTDIVAALAALYPDANNRSDYRLVDRQDGTGAHIEFWNDAVLGPQPTIEQMAAAEAQGKVILARYQIPTYVVVKRLVAAGLINAADAAIESDKAQKARFYTVGAITSDDAESRAFLLAIGANADEILAPE